MNKRLLSMILCVLLVAVLLPIFASAEDGKVIERMGTEPPQDLITVTLDEESFPLSNEELETAYLETLLYGKSERLNSATRFLPDPDLVLTPAEYAIEQYVKKEIIRIANGKRTETSFDISLENMGFTDADYAQVSLPRCVRVLLRDCTAELYWFGRSYSYNGSGPDFYLGLVVAEAYSDGTYYGVDATEIASARAAIENADAIVERHKNETDANKLRSYRDEICTLVDYNNDYGSYDISVEPNPWELVWVFDGVESTKVVCEGYSKAFEYLCNHTQFASPLINCYCVSGMVQWSSGGGGGHMWNIVSMDDGRNYLVDVTNCDNRYDPNVRFLKHAISGSVDEGYTIDTNDFYPYDLDTRISFLDASLTLSTQAYAGPVAGITPTPKPTPTPTPTTPPESTVLALGDNYVTVPASGFVYRPFTPTKGGYYRIYTTGNFDTYGVLTDSNSNELMHDDDSGSGYNFELIKELTAGTTYYVGIRFYSAASANSVKLTIEEYENPYPGYLEFDTQTIYGDAISSDILSGYDLVFVNFWAEWCNHCVGEMPDLQQLHEDYPNVLFLGVWVGRSETNAKQTLSQLGVTYPIIEPDGTLIGYDAQVTAIPTSFFFDRNGKQVGNLYYVGSNAYDGWKAILDDLLEQYGKPVEPQNPTLYGDVSGNGSVGAEDAAMVLRHVVHLIELSEQAKVNADVDGIRGLSAGDAAAILRYVVKLIRVFPVEQQ